MGKATTKAAPITEVVVKYDLFDMPTAQHKAGLAGLILQIRYMENTKRNYPEGSIPVIEEMTATSATIRFTEESVHGIFDALYEAEWKEIESKSKWPGDPPKEIREVEEKDPETKKSKMVKRFVYGVVQPCGRFLRDRFPAMDQTKDWHKLWRDMLWAIPRGNPQARLPFQDRGDGKPCREGPSAWAELVKVEKACQKNSFHTAEVAGSLWLGAQAINAESIPFVGRAEHNLLLHFWPLTVLIFVPQQIDSDGETDFVGYTLAIPEVADLASFIEDYPEMISQLGTDIRGYRPAEAVIDLPAQGALAFMEHLARLAAHLTEQKGIRTSIVSVEYMHLNKAGNNVKSLAAGRVAYRRDLVRGFQAIVGKPGEAPPFRSPLFRRGLLLALLHPGQQDWYQSMASMLVELSWPFFIHSEKSPKNLPRFWNDAAAKFQQLIDDHLSHVRRYQEMAKDDPGNAGVPPKTPIELLIHRLVRSYVFGKTQEKTGLEWDKIKLIKTPEGKINVPKEWNETKEKIASGAFLEMRSRREQAFVDHFTATFCSVKQFLPEDDFQVVACALLKEPENVKTLTLLALSANS